MSTVVVERCKCCESIRRSDPFGELTVDMVTNDIVIGDRRISVAGRAAEILCLLAKRTYVSNEGLEAVYRDIDSSDVKRNIWVQIHNARAALAGTGYKITNVRGHGYLLEREKTNEVNAAGQARNARGHSDKESAAAARRRWLFRGSHG